MNRDIIHRSIIGIFVTLYFLVATISMINSVAFFDLAHNGIMSWVLALGFELGAAASLAAIIILERTSKVMVWGLFILLTLFQMMANSFHAYINLQDYIGWIELFGLERMSLIEQKRILSLISGAVLPVVALGFIKSLVDYIRPDDVIMTGETRQDLVIEESIIEEPIQEHVQEPIMEEPIHEPIVEDIELTQEYAQEPIVEDIELTQEPVQDLVIGKPIVQETVQKPAVTTPQPVSPAKPTQQQTIIAKKMIPNNSGDRGGVLLRAGVKSAPVAGSPSR
jgi:hypothetical protein